MACKTFLWYCLRDNMSVKRSEYSSVTTEINKENKHGLTRSREGSSPNP